MPQRAEPDAKPVVLVTGAAGKIGRYVTKELRQQGFAVRALTSKSVTADKMSQDVDWRSLDFTLSLEFAPHVEGCAAIVHLAAEIVDRSRMQRVNVDATQALAKAAAAAKVDVFCYVSSAAVYGSSLERLVTENSPTIDPMTEVKGQHWAPPTVRHYARTKLLGERRVSDEAEAMNVIIVRPTVVVDAKEVAALATRSPMRKRLVGRRHAHHVYVADVAAAIVWLVRRAITTRTVPGVSLFNIAEDDVACRSYSDVEARLRLSGVGEVVSLPSLVDRLVEYARFGALPWRYAFGQMMFSAERLEREGFSFPHGMEQLYARMSGKTGRSA